MSEQSTELVVINAQSAIQIFTGGGMGAVLDGIEAKVRAIKLDPSTLAGREEIRSVAYKIARTKTALDAEGKRLTEGWREATAKVNAERKKSAERLELLQEEVRKPLTDFENKEKIRMSAHEQAILDFTTMREHLLTNPNITATELRQYESDMTSAHAGRNWEEFAMRAGNLRGEVLSILASRIAAREKHDSEQAELARLRAAEADRLQRERDERLKAEAAEAARLAAERKAKQAADAEAKRVIEAAEKERRRVAEEAERVRAENERALRAIEDSRRREESAKLAAEQRAKDAEDARLAAEAKAVADFEAARKKAKLDTDAAVVKERERVERERKAEADAQAKRQADEALKLRIRAEILEDLNAAATPVDAIMDGRVRHVRVVF